MPRIDELSLTLRELAARLAERGTFNFLLGNGLGVWAAETRVVPSNR